MTERTTPVCAFGSATTDPCSAPATHYAIDEDGSRVHWCARHASPEFGDRPLEQSEVTHG